MNILITGSTGFLGSYLLSEFKTNKVDSLSRRASTINCSLDISQPKFTKKYDLVIHSAGLAHVESPSLKSEDKFYNINVLGTVNLLKGFEKSFIPKCLVFISSVSVYGLVEGEKINEEAPLLASDSYGKSKIEAERIVYEWCKNYNVVLTILRLPLVAGINPPGNLKSMIKWIKKGYYFNIGGGRAKKSMVMASDVAKYILKAAIAGGIYNLTDGYNPSIKELSQKIASQCGRFFLPNLPFFIAKIIAKIGDNIGRNSPFNSKKLQKITSTLTFDDSKARKAFGWNPDSVLDQFKI